MQCWHSSGIPRLRKVTRPKACINKLWYLHSVLRVRLLFVPFCAVFVQLQGVIKAYGWLAGQWVISLFYSTHLLTLCIYTIFLMINPLRPEDTQIDIYLAAGPQLKMFCVGDPQKICVWRTGTASDLECDSSPDCTIPVSSSVQVNIQLSVFSWPAGVTDTGTNMTNEKLNTTGTHSYVWLIHSQLSHPKPHIIRPSINQI